MPEQTTIAADSKRLYLALAEALNQSRLDSCNLEEKTADLPSLTDPQLTNLAKCAMAASLQSPRRGWAIMAVAAAAAHHQDDDLLKAKANWHLGRLANEYGRPKLAGEALQRAKSQFVALHEQDWLAATTWQRHALCWASADLALAVQELQTAAAALENASDPFLQANTPYCQLTLAYAKLLVGDFDGLSAILDQCLTYFTNTKDILHQARTMFVRSGLLRRTEPFPKAKSASFEGLALAQAVGASADIARFHCQIGFNYWLCDGDYESAANSFEAGIDLFKSLDIPGWLAQCQDGLAQIYIMTGRLSEASEMAASALALFKEEDVFSQQVFILLTIGWLEKMKGSYQSSLDYLKQAEAGSIKLGNRKIVPVIRTSIGETYLQLGRFQQSLLHLEQAYAQLEQPSRLAECALRLARLWTKLDNPKKARYYLDKSKEHALEADHASALLAYYHRTAEYQNKIDNPQKAIDALKAALQLAQRQKNPLVEAQCRRQLAITFCRQNHLDEAVEQLTLAETSIKTMGLRHERAACLLIWGDIYRRQGRLNETQKAWTEAEQLSRTLMPDINWQAAASLAGLAEKMGNQAGALNHYRQMIQSLRLLREGFWQPELSGSYLKRPSAPLNRAVILSARNGRHQEALTFIEEIKAQTTARRIQAQTLFQEFKLIPQKAQHMLADIRWLQEHLRTSQSGQPFVLRSAASADKYTLLLEKIDAYIDQLNQQQRKQLGDAPIPIITGFDIKQFRKQANKHLGHHWAAMDYYLADDQLVCLFLTAHNVAAYPIDLPRDLLSTIKLLRLSKVYNGKPPLSLLQDAGQFLFPETIQSQLEEKKTVIIAPHRDLHHLPWAALHLHTADEKGSHPNIGAYRPLVDAVTPVIVPSLHTLSLLWQRDKWKPSNAKGLMLAVSEFHGRHSNLPAVGEEIKRLRPFLGENGRILHNEEATAENLLKEMGNNAGHNYWHIATHAFHDEHSGRLSGLALYGQDFWLDEFWQLAPLPGLVTFSACGSSKSRLFEGDEHVGLTTTCLTAGANHVIGSIWDVPDNGLAGIMTSFYSRLLQTKNGTAVPVSEALAQAQRHAWKSGENWQQWAGFRCTGRP